jgi:uncharacterized protein YkwD
MRNTLKKYFIPHRENNFHPHILHTKRAIFYSLVFLLAKVILVAFVVFLPTEVFVLPDVLAEEQRQIITLTNEARIDLGLPALAVVKKLNNSAQYKAEDMSAKEYFAHTKNNKTVATWLESAGYKYETAGENLAVGYSTAQDIVDAWKNSPTHYANLIDTDFKDFGVGMAGGVYEGQPTVFIAQHLASPLFVVGSVKESTKVVSKVQNDKKIINKVQTVNVNNATSSVLSAKIQNIAPNDLPVVNLKASTPIDKYIQAKSVLSPITNIFAISRNIYLVAIIFFVFVLLLNIVVEVRKQHPHVIMQTSILIMLLVAFWKF